MSTENSSVMLALAVRLKRDAERCHKKQKVLRVPPRDVLALAIAYLETQHVIPASELKRHD